MFDIILDEAQLQLVFLQFQRYSMLAFARKMCRSPTMAFISEVSLTFFYRKKPLYCVNNFTQKDVDSGFYLKM